MSKEQSFETKLSILVYRLKNCLEDKLLADCIIEELDWISDVTDKEKLFFIRGLGVSLRNERKKHEDLDDAFWAFLG